MVRRDGMETEWRKMRAYDMEDITVMRGMG